MMMYDAVVIKKKENHNFNSYNFSPRKTFFMQTSLFCYNQLIINKLLQVTLVTLTSPVLQINHRPIYPYIGLRFDAFDTAF